MVHEQVNEWMNEQMNEFSLHLLLAEHGPHAC